MSYCRFSDDNWKSDVYIYESDAGYVCHVAAARLVGNIPPLLRWEDGGEAYCERYKEQSEALEKAERVTIGGAFDGQSRVFDSPRDLLVFLGELIEAGYHVPEFALRAIEEEGTM